MAARIVAERDRHCVACVGELGGRCQTRAHVVEAFSPRADAVVVEILKRRWPFGTGTR